MLFTKLDEVSEKISTMKWLDRNVTHISSLGLLHQVWYNVFGPSIPCQLHTNTWIPKSSFVYIKGLLLIYLLSRSKFLTRTSLQRHLNHIRQVHQNTVLNSRRLRRQLILTQLPGYYGNHHRHRSSPRIFWLHLETISGSGVYRQRHRHHLLETP